jgi:hypothetical protein
MTLNIKRDYFLVLFDEFRVVPSQKIDAFIQVASGRVAPTVWGVNTQYATALLVAHMITMSGGVGGSGGSAAGPVTQEAVGDLSRSYGTVGVPGTGDQELLTTRYGQEFVALRRETVVSCMAVGSLPVGYCG